MLQRLLIAILLLTIPALGQDRQEAERLLGSARQLYQTAVSAKSQPGLRQALAEVDKAVAADSAYAVSYHLRGLIYHQLGQRENLESGLKDYDTALGLDANYADGYAGRANLLVELARSLKAKLNWMEEHNLKIGLSKDPALVDRRGRGRKEVLDLAIADYTKAISLKNGYTYYFLRGEAYRLQGNLTAAIADFEESSRVNPSFDTGQKMADALKNLSK